MRSILEKAIVHLLNEENEQAEALFHKFMVEKARQIHESLRSGDEALLESFDEVQMDEMFNEDDLSGLEDDSSAEGEFGDEIGGVDDAAGDVSGEVEGDEFASDETAGDEFAADDVAGDDLGGDEPVEGDDQATLDSIEAKLEDLQAQFDALVGGDDAGLEGEVEGDEFASDDMGGDEFGDDTMGGEVEGEPSAEESDDMADSMEDDMSDEPVEDEVSEEFKPFKKKGEKDEDCADEEKCNEEEEFDDITESIVSELEKVMVTMSDGKEIGAGKSFSQNNKSPALQKKPNPMTDGKPIKIDATEHQGFERETAPAVKPMKARKNTKTKGDQGQSKVSKEGDKSALINKTPGAESQTRSPLAKR